MESAARLVGARPPKPVPSPEWWAEFEREVKKFHAKRTAGFTPAQLAADAARTERFYADALSALDNPTKGKQ